MSAIYEQKQLMQKVTKALRLLANLYVMLKDKEFANYQKTPVDPLFLLDDYTHFIKEVAWHFCQDTNAG